MAIAKNIGFIIIIFSSLSCASKFSGRIMNDMTDDFAEGRVNILGMENSFQEVISIENTGSFSNHEEMPDGIYLVEVLVPGYEVFSKKIDIQGQKRIKLHLNKILMPEKKLNRISEDFDVSRASGSVSLTPPRL